MQSDLLRPRQQHHGGNIFDNHRKLRQKRGRKGELVVGKIDASARVTSSLFSSSAARFEYVPGRTEWRWCTSFTRSSVEWLSSGQEGTDCIT